MRRTHGIDLSEAVRTLLRVGGLPPRPPRRFQQRTQRLGLRIDVSNVVAALDEIDGLPAA